METRELLAHVQRIEIRARKAVEELTAGAYHSVFKGKGIEFDEVREYLPGDEIRDIDWNVTARMNKPFIKRYIEERELSVFILVDVSASGDFGTADRSKHRLATEIAALLALSAIRNQDRVGLMLFSSEEELHVPPRKGSRHGLRLIRELVACPRRNRGTDICSALESLMRANYRRGVVFLISDFIDTNYEKALRIAGKKHDLVAIRMLDPRDTDFPKVGLVTMEDAESGESLVFNSSSRANRRQYKEKAEAFNQATRMTILRSGVDLIDVRTDQDAILPLMRFFRRRGRRRVRH